MRMDPQLYKAAQLGNSDVIRQYADILDFQLTPNKNTVLHVLAQFCDSSYAIEQILGINHSLLNKLNAKGETALHIAARNRHPAVVRALIDCAKDDEKPDKHEAEAWKKMQRMTNNNGDVALHMAIRSNCYEIVEILVKEDDEFLHPQNKAGESPLYLAVERGYHDIVDLILAICQSPSYGGPCGTTALHLAAIRNSLECMDLLLDKLPNITEEADIHGQTALHYAARFNHQEGARLLLSADKSMAYMKSYKDNHQTALHVAVKFGHLNVVKEILSNCPDCWEMDTGDYQNIVHLAVKHEQQEVLDFILDNVWASELINEKDFDGNTPLHLYASSKQFDGSNLINHAGVDKNAINTANFTPLDVIIRATDQTERLSVIKDEMERNGATQGYRFFGTKSEGGRAEVLSKSVKCHQPAKDSRTKDDTYLIVAALIVTVTFAAGFTVPGGYENGDGPNKGLAILRHKPAFIVFVVADMIALGYSLGAVFLQFKFPPSVGDFEDWLPFSNTNTIFSIRVAMMAMVTAFLSGLFAVLPSPIIKALLCFAGIDFFLAFMGFYVIHSCSRKENNAVIQNLRKRCKIILQLACGRLWIAVVRFR